MTAPAVAPEGVTLRRADRRDVAAIVDIFGRARAAALPFLPRLHTPEEDFSFFSEALAKSRVTLACAECPIGFMVETESWIEHLYLDPDRRGQGIGQMLLESAKDRQPSLQLWCFADNHGARRFYERHGFTISRHTDGDNEEGLPDLLHVWQREPPDAA